MLQEFDFFDYEDESYQTSDLWKIYQTSYSIYQSMVEESI